jgi:hypothetical protein
MSGFPKRLSIGEDRKREKGKDRKRGIGKIEK